MGILKVSLGVRYVVHGGSVTVMLLGSLPNFWLGDDAWVSLLQHPKARDTQELMYYFQSTKEM